MSDLREALNRDQELSDGNTRRGIELIELRWHWTLDPDNPDRITVEEYARQTDKDPIGVQGQVLGYERWLAEGGDNGPTHLFKHWTRAENELRGLSSRSTVEEAHD